MGEEGDRRGTGGTEILGEGERGRPSRRRGERETEKVLAGTEIPGDGGRGRPKRYWRDGDPRRRGKRETEEVLAGLRFQETGEEGNRRGTSGTEIPGDGGRGRPKRYWRD